VLIKAGNWLAVQAVAGAEAGAWFHMDDIAKGLMIK